MLKATTFMDGELTDVNASVSNVHPQKAYGDTFATTSVSAQPTLAGR